MVVGKSLKNQARRLKGKNIKNDYTYNNLIDKQVKNMQIVTSKTKWWEVLKTVT